MEFLDKAGVETLWAKVKSIVPTDVVKLGAINQMTNYKPFEFRSTAEGATYGACFHTSGNHWRIRTGLFSNLEQNIVMDIDCANPFNTKLNQTILNKRNIENGYDGTTSGFSQWAWGVADSNRDDNTAYMTIHKPSAGTSGTGKAPLKMNQTDGTILALGLGDTQAFIGWDYAKNANHRNIRVGAGNKDMLNWNYWLVTYNSDDTNVSITGNVTATAFFESSDKNLKENIEDISNDKIANANNISFKSFNFKEDKDKTTKYGVIAQEVEEAGLNELVSEDEQHSKCVDYTSLLCLKMQAMEEKIKRLEEKIAMLENK